MGLFYLLFLTFLAVLFICLGWQVWKKQKITLIHSYHYEKVAEKDKKAYTKQMGKAMLVMGTGIFLTGLINFISDTAYGWGVFLLFFVRGLVMMLRAPIRYNHGIFEGKFYNMGYKNGEGSNFV